MTKHLAQPPVKATTLVELLSWRAQRHPDQRLYTFLVDGEQEEAHLTFGELDQQARAMAAWLQQLNMAGERALLLYPPGLGYIIAYFGCLYAGVVAVPAYPPRLNRPTPRLHAIVADAQATIALTTDSILSNIERRFEHTPDLAALRWLVTDTPPTQASDWRETMPQPDTLAFLQYTSGSTSAPKGVMLTHAHLFYNASLISYGLQVHPETINVSWLPPYHDMGLIGSILTPVYAGVPTVLMSPLAFLQYPARWLQVMTRYGGTIGGGPNFAYQLCLDRMTPEQRATLDLSRWELAFSGAEPIRRETMDRFAETFAPYGFKPDIFYPCYGLAEATLMVSGGRGAGRLVTQTVERTALERNRVILTADGDANTQTFIGCGQELLQQKIVIADPDTLHQVGPDQVGEIWVSSPSIAQGYWRKPEESERTFRARLAGAVAGAGPFLRTGDLGFIHQGELYITGRLKDLVIIRGRNHYPQDIELTVEHSHPALQADAGAVFAVEVDGEERLVVTQELKRQHVRQVNVDEIIGAIRQAIAENHELQTYAIVLLKTGSIPKTSSGKIQRHACRAEFLADTLNVVGQWQQDRADGHMPEADLLEFDLPAPPSPAKTALTAESAQTWLVNQVARRLKIDPRAIDAAEPLTRYGLDSLEAANISCELEVWLNRRLPLTLLADYPSIAELARYLAGEAQAVASGDGVEKWTDVADIPAQFCRFDLLPQYQELHQRIEMIDSLGVMNPYFKLHERVTNDTTLIGGREYINYSSYNYLGMSGDPAVSQGAKEAIDRYGTSVSASRIASGEKPLHRDLERALAEWSGAEDCIVYVGGHATNETTIGHLFGPNDLIMHDALIHNSAAQGCLLSGARSLPFPHNDWRALDDTLRNLRRRYERALIVIEGVYSMDGDIPDLPRFIEVKKRHKAFLMIDEAHSMGVLGEHGRGLGEYFTINRADVDLWMGTMSKSFASCGGYIAGCKEVVEYLKYTAPGFVYSVGITPQNAGAALAALRVLQAEPERVARLRARSEFFLTLARQRGLNTGQSKDSPVIPIIVGDSLPCMRLAHALFERGINVQPMIYPAVENSAARLRFFITCTHTEEQIRYTIDTVAEALGELQVASSK